LDAATTPQRDVTPLSQVRRITAERMATSAHTAAPVTLTTEADATALVRLRAELAEGLSGTAGPVPTYNDFFVKLVAAALRDFPDLNSSLVDGGIVRHESAHVGIAVDTERGLLVPVVRDAQAKALQTIAAETARLIAQARAGNAPHDALHGGTFTITNLGMYGIDAFTPIINLPECAILGIGRIVPRPVVIDEATEAVAVRKMVALSLTFDHRVVDGAPAARFLQRVKRYVEQPLVWLTR
jgi:pyruvate dehydrogenase E2 component (dihydrolipoamide acetyltransferase)